MIFSFTELFNYFAGLLGIIMSIVILAKMKGKLNIKLSLASYLLLTSVIVLTGTFNFSGKAVLFTHLLRIDSPLHFLEGPIALSYTLSSVKPGFRFRWIYLLHGIPFVVDLISFLPFYFSSSVIKLEYYNSILGSGGYVLPFQYKIKIISLTVYFILQNYYLIRYLKQVRDEEVPTKSFLRWFLIFMSCQGLALAGFYLDYIIGIHLLTDPFRFVMVMVSVLLISTAGALLFFPSLLYGDPVARNESREKYYYSTLSSDKKELIFQKLSDYFSAPEKPYLDADLSLSWVAKALNVSTTHLSQVINEKLNLNFRDFINSFRIEEAKRMLKSEEIKKLTIDAIAVKAGFKSRTPFYLAFKKHTGMTPKKFVSVPPSE